jgi:hypothetical protein
LIDHHKKVTIGFTPGNIKINIYYSGPILDVIFKKWFPLSEVFLPRTTTLKEPMSSTCQKK